MAARKQEPSAPENWLYRDFSENDRCFSKLVYLGVNDTEWPECTDAEKVQYEKSKKPISEIVGNVDQNVLQTYKFSQEFF